MSNSLETKRSPAVLLIILVVYVFLALFIFQVLGLALLIPFSDYSMMEFITAFANPLDSPDMKSNLLFVQAITSLGAFILAPWFFIHKHSDIKFRSLFPSQNDILVPMVLVAVFTVLFMVVNAYFVEWNMNFQFSEPFHTWAKSKEDYLQSIISNLTTFDSFFYWLACLIVIAVLPAIGEELLFRGIIQRYLYSLASNYHIAIWLTAFFFSAFHLQFFGLVPRMILGIFFGYMYYYSKNLWFPIVAHFINNGFTVLLLYLYQLEIITIDIENADLAPIETLIFVSIVLVFLFGIFIRRFKDAKTDSLTS